MKSIAFAAFFALLAMGDAKADPRDDALSAMLRCSGIADRAPRLACYDSAVVRVPGALNTMSNRAPSSSPLVTASAVPPAAPAVAARKKRSSGFMARLFGADGPKRAPQTTVAQFGSESIANGGREAFPIPMDSDTIDQISARLVSYEFSGGYVTVTLDNGQVWRQTADGNPLQWLSRPALAYSAVISRGGAGSYDMKLSGQTHGIAVRRIR